MPTTRSKALARDSMMKKYMKRSPGVEWERRQAMKKHYQILATMRPAVDNKAPAFASCLALNKKRQQLEEDKLSVIEGQNLRLLKRLQSISNRMPSSWCSRKRKPLARGDAYRGLGSGMIRMLCNGVLYNVV